MTTDRETLQRMAAWLEDGRTQLPDHVLDAVLEGLPSKPQRRPRWPARRIASMNPIAKFAIAAAAVVVVAVVGVNLLSPPAPSQVGGIASPSPVPSSSPAPLLPLTDEIIPPGRYRWTSPSADVSFDLPAGWIGREESPGFIETDDDSPTGYAALNFTNARYEDIRVFPDPCHDPEPGLVGSSVDDLVAALDDQESTDAVVGEMVAGSVTGKRIELRETAGLDRSQCVEGAEGPFRIWVNPAGNDFNAWGSAGRGLVYVFDVDGQRLVFAAGLATETTDAVVEEVDAILESVEFSTP